MSEFDKIIGYEDIKAELSRFADVLKEPEKYMKLGVTVPSGIMLYGDPGVGKTLMAKCFIAETGCKVYMLRKEKPNGDFVNEIRETFEAAKREEGISIVFLDDMDKYANEDGEHKDAEEYVAVQSCIDDCRGSGVFVFATANNKYNLPDSLYRSGRFDKVIEVDVPRGKDAEKIIEHYLSQKQVMGDVDTEEISRLLEGQSCANLKTVINEAGIYAGYAGKDVIEQKDIIKACMREMFDSPECINPSDNLSNKCIAVHEAGHAVVSEVLDPGSVTLVSICRHLGSSKGITKIHKPDGYNTSKALMDNRIIMKLGGKAATEVVYGISDVGCSSDMSEVFYLVDTLVDEFCCNGFEAHSGNFSSEYTREMKDRLIVSEINRYYQMAKKIIIENRKFIDAVTDALLDHKTVTYRELQGMKKMLMIV